MANPFLVDDERYLNAMVRQPGVLGDGPDVTPPATLPREELLRRRDGAQAKALGRALRWQTSGESGVQAPQVRPNDEL